VANPLSVGMNMGSVRVPFLIVEVPVLLRRVTLFYGRRTMFGDVLVLRTTLMPALPTVAFVLSKRGKRKYQPYRKQSNQLIHSVVASFGAKYHR